MTRPNLLGLPPLALREALDAHFRRRGQPDYRTRQVEEWVFAGGTPDPDAITNLPVRERAALAECFRLDEPVAEVVSQSPDGTVKHLWRLADGEVVESVLIPAADRLTLCISSQAGCALACSFCATGWSGFRRQLTTAEIVGQYRASARWAREHGGREHGAREHGGRPVSNVVFMGMGEPLANRRHVFPALSALNAGYGIGARRIVVSTVGVVPGILALAEREEQFRLALSLHAPVSNLRQELVPLEKRYPLDQVIDAVETYARKGGRRLTFEYTMIRDVNDALELVPPLAALARRVGAFVNLIPFNPIPDMEWQPSPGSRLREFAAQLEAAGVAVAVRRPRGREIDAACGQLRAARVGSAAARTGRHLQMAGDGRPKAPARAL